MNSPASSRPRSFSPLGIALLTAFLITILALIKLIDRLRREERIPIDFLEKPALPTQRLGLSGLQD